MKVCKTLNVGSSTTVASETHKGLCKAGAFSFPERPSSGQAAPVSYYDAEAEDKIPGANPAKVPRKVMESLPRW